MAKRRPIFLLHGTSSIYLPLIQEQGLKDPYLTDSEKMAAYFAEQANVWDGPTLESLKEQGLSWKGAKDIVLQVAVFDPSHLQVDREMWSDPLDWIKRKHHIERDQEWYEAVREGYIDSPESPFDWQISLKMVHAVKYQGTIPPDQIGRARRPRS